MVWNFPSLLLFMVVLLVYFIRPSWSFLLGLITTPLLAPFMVLYSGIGDFQEQQSYVWALWGVFNRAYLLIILFEVFVRRKKLSSNLKVLIAPGIILSFFLVFHNVVNHFDLSTMYGLLIGLVYTVPPMVVLMLNKEAWPSIKSLYWVVFIIYAIEIIWIPLNLMGVFAYSARYQELISGELDMICGTFTRSNMLADYVAFTYFFLVLDYLIRRKVPFLLFLVISIMAFILLFAAGSKLPIVAVVISIMYSIVLFKKDKIGIVICALLVFAGIILFLSTNKIEPNTSYEGFNRIVGEMSTFVQSKVNKDEDESTFGISKELLDNYFLSSPIVGNGYSYKGNDNAYPISRSGIDLSALKADATFAYYLVEFGLMGTLLYIIFYYNVIKCACSFLPHYRKKIVLAVFLFYILFSATEGGLFSMSLYTYAYTFLFSFTRSYNE